MPALLAIGMASSLTPTTGLAQLELSLDGGWASVRYDEYLRSTVASFTPTLLLETRRASFSARGTYSRFESGSRSLDTKVSGSVFTGSLGSLRAEIGGAAGGTIYNGVGTGHYAVQLRLHSFLRSSGFWVGGSAGYVDDGIAGTGVQRYEAGAWARLGMLTGSATAVRTSASDIRVTDAGLGVRALVGPFEISASAGTRSGGRDLLGRREWGEGAVAAWLNRRVSLVAGYGTYPSDPSRGTPGGSYTALSMRVSTGGTVIDEVLTRATGYRRSVVPDAAVQRFELRQLTGDSREISVVAPGARSVELMGDFTDWEPRQMERVGDNRFTLRVELGEGSYRLNLRVDAGEWGVPPGVLVANDEFGAVVGLLIISGK